MLAYNYFIGTDIGKTTNAVCVIDQLENWKLELTIPNSKTGMETLLKQLNKLPSFRLETELKTNLDLLMSIPGVGRQTALFMLIFTGNFTRFQDVRKLASYAGVAPFAYESGTSVRGRTKVSQMANTKLKHLLHMAALAAVKAKGELRDYFDRKVAAGKRKMSVYNAIRNKLVHRMVAVMERRTAYTIVYEK